jgi:hypothetical protein
MTSMAAAPLWLLASYSKGGRDKGEDAPLMTHKKVQEGLSRLPHAGSASPTTRPIPRR